MTQPDLASSPHETHRPERAPHGLPLGDRVVRPVREHRIHSLRKVLGVGALYSIGYGNVGSSIYYAMGITAVYALGATPLVLAIAGLLFAFTALTYAEGSAMIPEAGGASSFARRGFNDLVSFVAGWALMLDYIVIIAISAITVPSYLAYFFPVLKRSPAAAAWVGIGVIAILMVVNILGVKQTSGVNLAFCVLDLVTQAALLIVGGLLLLNPKAILAALPGGGSGVWATPDRFLYSISIAMVAYIGLESISQMAEEARDVARSIPRALLLALATILVMHTGISTVALSAMRPEDLATQWSKDPVAGIAQHLPSVELQSEVMTLRVALNRLTAPWVAVLASSILMIAANAGILGVSRLAFSMGLHQQLPSPLVRLHHVFRTPYIAILCFCAVAIALLVPSFSAPDILLKLGDLYSFGAMLAFTIAHASIIALRFRAPDLPRPFRPWGEVPLLGRRVPVSALLGFMSTLAAWVVVLATHRWGRLVGFLWLLGGVAIYALYRRRKGLNLMTGPAAEDSRPPSRPGLPVAAASPDRG